MNDRAFRQLEEAFNKAREAAREVFCNGKPCPYFNVCDVEKIDCTTFANAMENEQHWTKGRMVDGVVCKRDMEEQDGNQTENI